MKKKLIPNLQNIFINKKAIIESVFEILKSIYNIDYSNAILLRKYAIEAQASSKKESNY